MTWKSYVGLGPNVWQVQHSWGRRWGKIGDVCKELSPDGHHKESTVCQPDIACSADWLWTRKTIFGRSSGETFDCCGGMTAADKRGCESECHGWFKWHRFGQACTKLCSCMCEVESHCKGNYYQGWRWDLVIWLKLLCSSLHYSIFLPSSFISKWAYV